MQQYREQSLALTAIIPHDYRPDDLIEYYRGQAAVVIGGLVALAGGVAALMAIGRNVAQDARLCGIGVYLVGVGIALYWMLDGAYPTCCGSCAGGCECSGGCGSSTGEPAPLARSRHWPGNRIDGHAGG